MDFLKLKNNLKNKVATGSSIKVGLLADSASQFLKTGLQGYALEFNIDLQIYEADYDQIESDILNPNSDLYQFDPHFVLIFYSVEKMYRKFNRIETNHEKILFSQDFIEKVERYTYLINSKLKSNIIISNIPEMRDGVFGNYANKNEASFIFQIRKMNYELMVLSTKIGNLFVNDLVALQNEFGRNNIFSPSLFVNSSIVYNLDFIPKICENTLSIIRSIRGEIKKCLILDLDNTLWGGVIGDDGLGGIQIGSLGIGEAFSDFQMWVKQLQLRGVILAVCSKNEEKAALEPFLQHADMVLKKDDIAVFIANWENKADNIRKIQAILNIGFDSMVFLDDNPVERKIVRENIPDILVPDLPEDPAEYLSFVSSLNLFETASVSANDSERTKQYQEESLRMQKKFSFVNEDEFLKSLHMKCVVRRFEKLETPRIAQLSQRSNQFNLRTVRLTEEDVDKIIASDKYQARYFKLSDQYGDYGLVSFVILEIINENQVLIHSWLMSCRVLKRGLENLVLNEIVAIARELNMKKILGEFIPTRKNDLVKDHYTNLGFNPTDKDNLWELEVEGYTNRIHYIEYL